MIAKTIYTCEFCLKEVNEIEEIKFHELNCDLNPENKTCLSCEFFGIRHGSYVDHGICDKPDIPIFWDSKTEYFVDVGMVAKTIFRNNQLGCPGWKLKEKEE